MARPIKPIKVVHPSHARTVLSEQDAARLRAQGWLELDQGRAVTKGAAAVRRFRQRRKESGERQLMCWLPNEIFAALMSEKRPGETTASLLVRLTKAFRLIQ